MGYDNDGMVERQRNWSRQQSPFLVAQFCVGAWCCWLWFHIPNPGWAVAILAFVAAAMSIHGNMRGWQKAIWMVLIGGLLVVELRAISKDRAASNAEALRSQREQEDAFRTVRDAQDAEFRATVRGLEIQISQNNELLSKTSEINRLAQESLSNVTGGRSYAAFMGSSPSIGWALENRGESVLHDVEILYWNVDEFDALWKNNPHADWTQISRQYHQIRIGDMAPHQTHFVHLAVTDAPTTLRLGAQFSAANGNWFERFSRRVDGTNILRAILVVRLDGSKTTKIYEKIDKGFPLDKNGEPLW